MKKTIVAIVVCAALFVPLRSFASDLPSWTLNRICAEESDSDACREFEAVARYQISGPWNTIPEKVQTICLTEATTFQRPSFRMLRICLEAKLLEMHQSARKARVPAPKQQQ